MHFCTRQTNDYVLSSTTSTLYRNSYEFVPITMFFYFKRMYLENICKLFLKLHKLMVFLRLQILNLTEALKTLNKESTSSRSLRIIW